jgi:DNA helicase-2/ATP-dependent DNA helicase PcrA
MAVLCRGKSSGISIANELKKRQIPFEFIGKPDYFYRPIIKDLICLLKTVENPVFSNVEMVRTLEREVFCLKKTHVAKLTNLAHAKMCGIYEVFDFIDQIDIDKTRFLKIKKDIDNLIDHKNKLNVKELVYEILFNNDFYKYELQFNNIENISYLDMFYKFVEEYTYLYPKGELPDFISYLDLASEFGLEEEREDQESIKIMTVHSAKGKEFDNVFIVDTIDRKFPSLYRDDKFEIPQSLLKGTRSSHAQRDLHIQEERRLFYVAITRTKNRLTILYPKRYHSNTTDSQPSRFLVDINYKNNPNINFRIIKKENVLGSDTYKNDQQFKITKEIIADIRTDNFIQAIRKVLLIANIRSADIHEIINNISELDYVKLEENMNNNPGHNQLVNGKLEFSASQFNTYERCPRIYQYRYIYKIPGKPKPYFDFGSTVHMVIEELTNRIRDGQIVDKQIASEILKRMWNPKGFESKLEEKKSLQEISVILEHFLEETRGTGRQILDLEKKFTIYIDDYLVNGVIDRIDSDGNDYVIIDYKTSRESFGPKKASEDIQLVLYSLAVQKLYGRTPKLVGWWFLRQNKKIMVQITIENIEILIKKMNKIVESIRKSDFHPEPGWICKNCDYRLVCNDAKY